MNYTDTLPDADYRGPWTTEPLEDRRLTLAEELDLKCSEVSR